MSFLQLDGGVSGFVYPTNHTFNVEAGLKACLRGLKLHVSFVSVKISPCLSVGGVISSNGIGFCGVVPVPFPIIGTIDVPVGAGYHWGDSTPDLMVFSCDYSAYRQASPLAARDRHGGRGTARAAAGAYAVTLPSGLPASMFRVDGVDGAPQVTVTDPHGHDATAGHDALIVDGTRPGETLVALRHPAGGRWTIAAKPGSVAIAGVQSATALPPLDLKASVTGSGARRVLRYRVGSLSGRSITFLERGHQTARVLGRVRGNSGRITFAPAPAVGRGDRRTIVAVVSESGVPSRDLHVATYTPPKHQRLHRPKGLRATRRRGTISAAWHRVAGAQRYEVLIRLADGSRVFRITKRTRITTADPFPHERGIVLVDALGAGNVRGPRATVSLRR